MRSVPSVVFHFKEVLVSFMKDGGNVDLYAEEYVHTHPEEKKSKHIVFPTSTRGMLSQIITGGLSLSLVAATCEPVETTVGCSGGSAVEGSKSVSRDSGGGGGGGGVDDLRLASYGPGNSS